MTWSKTFISKFLILEGKKMNFYSMHIELFDLPTLMNFIFNLWLDSISFEKPYTR